MESLEGNILGIDHLAIAVPDLQAAMQWIRANLGFVVVEERETVGARSGMKSAVLRLGAITLVLVEGIGESSQVSEFIRAKGPGVQHVALRVRDLSQAMSNLQGRGVKFWTPRLDSDGLSQIFCSRDPATGMMFEFIERRDFDGFRDENVARLFESLEKQSLF